MPRERSRKKAKKRATIDFSPEPRVDGLVDVTETDSSDIRRSKRSQTKTKKAKELTAYRRKVQEKIADLESEEEEEEILEEEEEEEEEVNETEEAEKEQPAPGDFDDGGFVKFAMETFCFSFYGSIAIIAYCLAILVFVIMCAWLAPDASYLKNLIVSWQPADLPAPVSDEDRKDAFPLPHKPTIRIPGLPGVRLFGHNIHDVPAEGSDVDCIATAMSNFVLLVMVAGQLTIMNLPFYRSEITGFISSRVERSVFLFVSAISIWFLIEKWEPLPHYPTLWSAPYNDCFWVMFFSGCFLTVFATFVDDHFRASGLKQAFGFATEEGEENRTFPRSGLYRYVRQPAKLGFLIMVWSTPMMTGSRLLFALFSTVYLISQSQLEDNQLKQAYGKEYEEYQAVTPMLVPVQLLT